MMVIVAAVEVGMGEEVLLFVISATLVCGAVAVGCGAGGVGGIGSDGLCGTGGISCENAVVFRCCDTDNSGSADK